MTSADGAAPHQQLSVSIVIPVHNKATITRQCLDALLAEPDDGVVREIVIVDDGSSDRTSALLTGCGDSIRVVRNESALGFAGACNAGFAAARGEFVVLLNNDTIPTTGWLPALVGYARQHPRAAVVGAKLIFPNDTIQHAGVVFGLDSLPHHIYSGFPADHPATMKSRRYQVVTAACALFRREPWQELGGLDTAYRNGWEDVDFCLRAGRAGYEIHYCAESVVYHLESATRDLLSATERANRDLFVSRWQHEVMPDDLGYFWADGLLSATYGARYPFTISVSPLLAGVAVGENDRLADRLLFDRSRQVMILLRNNIVLNVRVQEAETRAAEAERRMAAAEARQANLFPPLPKHTHPNPSPIAMGEGLVADQLARQESAPLPATSPDVNPPSPPAGGEGGRGVREDAATSTPPGDATAAPETPALPHRIVGMVESPGRLPEVVTDGVLIISGWTLTDTGEARVEVFVNGASRGEIPYGDPRPDADALYPGFPAGADCGFASEIQVGDLPDGMHDLTIRITAAVDSQAELKTTFEVDNHAYERGRVIGRLDLPGRGTSYLSREVTPVSGWVLAPSGIRSLEVTVDGEPRGRVDYGALRPDIAKRRKQYADADHCGFSGSVPFFGLAEGHRELTVVATANDGQQLEFSTRIVIEGTETVDAGLPVINRHYQSWLDQREAVREARTAETLGLGARLVFEVIVPVSGDCADGLGALAASIRAQIYRDWRLTLVDSGDAGEDALIEARRLAASDGRITFREFADEGIIDRLNTALAASGADWVTLLTPCATLSPDAFDRVARALGNHPQASIVYNDDDRCDPVSGMRWNPFFKPDWSPDLFLAMNYLGPLTLFRRELAGFGGIRRGAVRDALYDLALRVSEGPGDVVHVPEVLVTSVETAPEPGEPWHAATWRPGEREAIAEALSRRAVDATVEQGLHPGLWRVRYTLAELPAVTAVIPTGGKMDLLRPCLMDLLERTDYPNLEILLIDNSRGEDVANLASELARNHPNVCRVVDERTPFNFPALVNGGVAETSTPYVLMLNDDITVIDPGWLRAMMEHAQRTEVGVVGAKLLYPDDTIQHAGVVLGPFSGSIHVFKRFPGADPGYFDLPDAVRNCSAVTFACALIDRAVFDQIEGMDEENFPVAFNDVDFCLRAREAGYEVIYTPHATLYHHESVTKTVIAHPSEIGYLRSRWGHVIDHDPYYNPNLTRTSEDARLNMEPVRVA